MDNPIREVKLIHCPYCGWEYDPSEILYPDNVLGKVDSKSIVRDGDGKIIYKEYEEDCEPLAEDVYYCDHCGKAFVIKINTEFTTEAQKEELDFSDTSSSLL